jgi:hypothetical protein
MEVVQVSSACMQGGMEVWRSCRHGVRRSCRHGATEAWRSRRHIGVEVWRSGVRAGMEAGRSGGGGKVWKR